MGGPGGGKKKSTTTKRTGVAWPFSNGKGGSPIPPSQLPETSWGGWVERERLQREKTLVSWGMVSKRGTRKRVTVWQKIGGKQFQNLTPRSFN